ncbi:MAG: Hpt domain-containing protein [Maribacter sp.]|nr:Hpt domain-containing protein [Maribacter sp.]
MKKMQHSEASEKNFDLQDLGENVTIELAAILDDCMGDMGLLEELIRLYKQNAVEFIGGAKLFINNGDFAQLKLAAHKIKCGLAMMHTYHLRDIVIEMHEQCETDKNLDRIKYLNNLFITEYLAAEKKIDAAFTQLGNKKI